MPKPTLSSASRQLVPSSWARCRSGHRLLFNRGLHASSRARAKDEAIPTATTANAPTISIAPRVQIDVKAIRLDPELYERNARERNYKVQAAYPREIQRLMQEEWQPLQERTNSTRQRANNVRKLLSNKPIGDGEGNEELKDMQRDELLAEAVRLKGLLAVIEAEEKEIMGRVDTMAQAIPNLTSPETPRGNDFEVVGYINEHPEPTIDPSADRSQRSHTYIGQELGLLDFAGAGTTSGWGWYYLLNEAADLEQALVQYALSVARKRGWGTVSPPTMVYSHIASACGFQPRDLNGEQQVYGIQQNDSDKGRKPEMCLAGTAEIPLAGMKANTTIKEEEMPLKRVAVSRCYRAEAGARGLDTKGLYRVHEFTKVEMFAWTLPSLPPTTSIFAEMLTIQTEILTSLGLHCRILEMPSTDLGASAYRKRDIEAYFPSRREKDEGWGEVTSTSICTDYQARRLGTRVENGKGGGRLGWAWTVNGTALAVPRVLAAVLENGWDQEKKEVRVPECLWPWMGGVEVIRKK